MLDAREVGQKLILSAGYWSGASVLANRFLSPSGGILMLHRVNRGGPSPLGVNSHLTISPEFLDRLLSDLRGGGLSFVSMDEMVDGLQHRRKGMIAVTLDDGWLDNFTDALPVFQSHGVPFTVYATTGFMSAQVEPWWELAEEFVARGGEIRSLGHRGESLRQRALRLMRYISAEMDEQDQQAFLARIGAIDTAAPRRFMDWNELRVLAAHPLATIGAHTVHHYNLRRLDEASAFSELVGSADHIEREIGVRPKHFAYPYGSANAAGARELDLARRAGFQSAVTTRHGVLMPEHRHHLHALPRISINGNYQRISYARTLLSGLTTLLANRGQRLVTL